MSVGACIVSCLALCAISCVVAQEPPAPSHKVGVVYGLTGPAQVWADFGRMGLQMAQEEINAAGGVNGRPIELIIEDSKTVPASAVTAYRKLVTQNKVKVVIGDVWDFITNPMIPLAQRDKVLLLSPTTMPHALETRSGSVFTAGHRTEQIASAVDHFFVVNPKVKRVGILCWDDAWGHAYLKVWRKAIERNGATVAATVCNVDFATDYRTDVLKVAAAKVDAIFIAHLADVALKRIKEQGLAPVILTSSNVVEDLKVKQAPPELFEGIYFTDWRPSEDFVAAFTSRFGKEPVCEAHNSYEALRAIAKALAINSEDPVTALGQVRYQGVEGTLDFSDPVSASQTAARLYTVRGGKIVEVMPGLKGDSL